MYKENHALDAWFKKAYGDEEKSLLKIGSMSIVGVETKRK